jgi:hypothetical protein
LRVFLSFTLILCCFSLATFAQQASPVPNKITVTWEKTIIVSRSTPTFQVVVNPMLRAGSPIHDSAFAAIKALHPDFIRYVPWLSYPKLGVAELEPPTLETTSWDFSLIDPMTHDFLEAANGAPTVMNFSTIPVWLFNTAQGGSYPSDPNQMFWYDDGRGTELREPTGKELGDYYARLVSWYVNGGFTDENGNAHKSGYHYEFPIWEVLNLLGGSCGSDHPSDLAVDPFADKIVVRYPCR